METGHSVELSLYPKLTSHSITLTEVAHDKSLRPLLIEAYLFEEKSGK